MKKGRLLIIGTILLSLTGCGRIKLSEVKDTVENVKEKVESIKESIQDATLSEEGQFQKTADKFFEAVDNRDAEGIKVLIAPDILKEDTDIDEQIERLFAFYPGPTEYKETDEGVTMASHYSNDHGTKTAQSSTWFAVKSNGIAYYCDLTLNLYNHENENLVGIQSISVMCEKYFVYQAENDIKRPYPAGLNVHEDTEEDFPTQRIGGYPFRYQDYERTIQEEDVMEFIEEGDFRYSKFVERFGEPNAPSEITILAYYELETEEPVKQFLELFLDGKHPDKIITLICIIDEDDVFRRRDKDLYKAEKKE